MTDSVAIFPPGFRVFNSSGAVVSGAKIKVFDAGTSTTKTVYSDKELTTSLGSTVTCDSAGYPTSDGTTKCQVYTGIANYKVRITTSADVTLSEHDNVKGALDTSGFGAGDAATFETPVLTKSLDYTVLTSNQSTLFNVNCSGGDVILTLPSAVTAGDGFRVGFRHAGSANQAVIATVSSQTIAMGTTTGTRMSLESIGETIWIVSDGANWNVDGYVPRIKGTLGVIVIADRLNTPPGSPVQGAKYIVTSGPAGDWSTFAEHDVAEYQGTGTLWTKITPGTDAGWIAYVQDEDIYYRFTGTAWAAESATTSVAGSVRLADAAAMEAATAGRGVTADLQHRHAGHPKAWGKANAAGAISADYGISSVTDVGTGDIDWNWDTAFSSVNYCACPSIHSTAGNFTRSVYVESQDTTHVSAQVLDGAPSTADPDAHYVSVFGDQ
jgi:hypothetical protein